jgi:hypothetical protein
MNGAENKYSPFAALILFFAAVLVFDLDQTVKVHREKLEVMRQYAQALKIRPQAQAQLSAIEGMRNDLLRLAPGHPEASQIVAELHLAPADTRH